MTEFQPNSNGLKNFDTLQNPEEDVPEDVSISPGALDKRDKVTSPKRGRGQTAREWVENQDIEIDRRGFVKDMNGNNKLSEVNESADMNRSYLNKETRPKSTKYNATLEGVQVATNEILERDIVTVNTPEMDRTGANDRINVGVDTRALSSYMEEVSEQFNDEDYNANTTAAVAIALDTIFGSIEGNYDGDVKMRTQSASNAVPDNREFDYDVEDTHYDGAEVDRVVDNAIGLQSVAENAVGTYKDNIESYEKGEIDSKSAQESQESGILGRFF